MRSSAAAELRGAAAERSLSQMGKLKQEECWCSRATKLISPVPFYSAGWAPVLGAALEPKQLLPVMGARDWGRVLMLLN